MKTATDIPDEGKDICCICGSVQDVGTMKDVNPVDFELLCSKCIGCRCSNCANIKLDRKTGENRWHCTHRGNISDPKNKVCDHWKRNNIIIRI